VKKSFKKTLAVVLVITCFLTTSLAAYASPTNPNEQLQNSGDNAFEFVDNTGNVIRIELYEDENGITGKQYIDGKLDCISSMEKNSRYLKRLEGEKITYVDTNKLIKKLDLDTQNFSTNKNTRGSYYLRGTHKYDENDGHGYEGHKINVYLKTETYQSQYNIQSYTGKVVDLVVLVAGSLNLPLIMAKKFVQALIYNAFLYVASGVVKKVRGIRTLACLRTDCNWKIVDADDPSVKDYTKGSRYIINAKGEEEYGKVYSDGWIEEKFYTQKFKIACHEAIFGY
jgi:hypothetical protein